MAAHQRAPYVIHVDPTASGSRHLGQVENQRRRCAIRLDRCRSAMHSDSPSSPVGEVDEERTRHFSEPTKTTRDTSVSFVGSERDRPLGKHGDKGAQSIDGAPAERQLPRGLTKLTEGSEAPLTGFRLSWSPKIQRHSNRKIHLLPNNTQQPLSPSLHRAMAPHRRTPRHFDRSATPVQCFGVAALNAPEGRPYWPAEQKMRSALGFIEAVLNLGTRGAEPTR
jgi:hypothetical protein